MERDQFIKILTNSTPAEMNEFIESKGKKGKSICPVIFHKNTSQQNSDNRRI